VSLVHGAAVTVTVSVQHQQLAVHSKHNSVPGSQKTELSNSLEPGDCSFSLVNYLKGPS
jgi:hypothetical protein